jgi:hypothetical protein
MHLGRSSNLEVSTRANDQESGETHQCCYFLVCYPSSHSAEIVERSAHVPMLGMFIDSAGAAFLFLAWSKGE